MHFICFDLLRCQAKSLLQMTELKCRKRVLRRLGYCTAADVIELKGRVACELSSADELLLTEMIFNGASSQTQPRQIQPNKTGLKLGQTQSN